MALCLVVTPVAGVTAVDAGGGPTPSVTTADATTNATATDPKATIDGWVMYQNTNQNMSASPHTEVIIRKRTSLVPTNKKITTVYTNESGYFSAQIDVSEWESNVDGNNDRLRLRVQALAYNDAVNVVNFGKNQGTANGNTWTVNNDGSIDRGDSSARFNFSITSEDERRAFQIANWTLEAYDSIENQTDGWTRKRVKARYPAVNNDQAQFRGFLEKFNLGRNQWDNTPRRTTHHEYGHAVMSGLFGYKGWQIPKYKKGHNIWSPTGRIYAWYEGFAMFMESVVVRNPWVHHENLESFAYFNDPHNHNGSTPDSTTGDFDGAIVEGATANILWDLYDPANEPHDNINGTLMEVFEAVNEKDNAAWGRPFNNGRTRDIHDFFIQYTDNHPDRYEDLRKIYFEYGINKPDRFEHDPTGSGSTCIIYDYPCEKMDAEKWSPLTANTSVDAGLGASDVDYYRVDLKEEQNVTVNATVTDEVPSSSPDINVSVGASKTATEIRPDTENGPHEEVTFVAKETGTYYVGIGHDGGGSGPELTYTLNVNATPQPPQTNEQDDVAADATVLDPFRIGDHVNTTERSAYTAKYDHDYYAIDLSKGERIIHAGLENGPGLSVAFENSTGQKLQTFDNGASMNTTTAPQGRYYFNVSGAARHSEYTLNVTTQRISQLYEDNDAKSAAADLEKDLDLEVRPTNTGTNRGTTQCPSQGGDNPAAGNTGIGGLPGDSGTTVCSRHDWRDGGYVSPGYAPNDPDWYKLTLKRNERINVSTDDDRLGVELYHGGSRVADAPAGPDAKISYLASSAGTYYINVTGEAYVPVHQLYVWRFLAEGTDRLEPNDEQSNAHSVTAASSGNHTESFDLLKLAGSDEDYLAVSLDDGDTLNATLTHLESAGDVSLTVIEPGGRTVTGTDPRPSVVQRATEMKRAELTAGQSGTYYVRVSGSLRTALKYNLTIRTSSPDTGGFDWSSPIFEFPVIKQSDVIANVELATPPEFDFERIDVGPATPTCSVSDTETRTRQIGISAGTSERIQETRTFTMDYPSPCKVVARVTGPSRAEVDVYVTLDGSEPSPTNYDRRSENPGSTETITIERSDGLERGAPIRVTVEGYPIAGTYEVVVEKYSDA